MTVFHFDLVGGINIVDAGGHPCVDLHEAGEIARDLALRLVREEPQLVGKGFAISVKTEDGEEVYRAQLDTINRLVSN
jgi:hypothetical protein